MRRKRERTRDAGKCTCIALLPTPKLQQQTLARAASVARNSIEIYTTVVARWWLAKLYAAAATDPQPNCDECKHR